MPGDSDCTQRSYDLRKLLRSNTDWVRTTHLQGIRWTTHLFIVVQRDHPHVGLFVQRVSWARLHQPLKEEKRWFKQLRQSSWRWRQDAADGWSCNYWYCWVGPAGRSSSCGGCPDEESRWTLRTHLPTPAERRIIQFKGYFLFMLTLSVIVGKEDSRTLAGYRLTAGWVSARQSSKSSRASGWTPSSEHNTFTSAGWCFSAWRTETIWQFKEFITCFYHQHNQLQLKSSRLSWSWFIIWSSSRMYNFQTSDTSAGNILDLEGGRDAPSVKLLFQALHTG